MLLLHRQPVGAGLIFVMSEKTIAATSDQWNNVEQVSNLILLGGVLAVFLGNGIWFTLGIVAIILGVLGTLATLIAKRENWHTITERLMIIGMMLGIVGMFQANSIRLYEYGFYVLGLCTLGFIIILHVPKPQVA